MMWVCPVCWQIFSSDQAHCPACGADLTALDQRSYTEKLIRALEHPDPETAMRAADVLARRGNADDTIPILTRALRRRWHEPYVAAAIVRALGRFPFASHDALIEALGHESVIVRAAAAEYLQGDPKPPRR
jgi:HEAT repeat protein